MKWTPGHWFDKLNAYNGQNIPDKEVSVDVKSYCCNSCSDDNQFCQVPVRLEVPKATPLEPQKLLANVEDDEDDKSGQLKKTLVMFSVLVLVVM